MDVNLVVLLKTVAIGIGATVCMDLWAQLLKRVFSIPALNWGLVGRWIANLPSGQWVHSNILKAKSFSFENVLGWGAHYGVGIVFALGFVWYVGTDWVISPAAAPAWVFGISTVVFPFFIMQPGLGMGVAASNTSNPLKGQFLSLVAHSVFGLGMFATALLINL